MEFKISDKVVCIVPNHVGWSDDKGNNVVSPSYDEILEIDFINVEDGVMYLGFYKYNIVEGYNAIGFRKLDYDFVEDVIKSTKEKSEFTNEKIPSS